MFFSYVISYVNNIKMIKKMRFSYVNLFSSNYETLQPSIDLRINDVILSVDNWDQKSVGFDRLVGNSGNNFNPSFTQALPKHVGVIYFFFF